MTVRVPYTLQGIQSFIQDKAHKSSVSLRSRSSGRRKCGFTENPYEGEPNKRFDQANQY